MRSLPVLLALVPLLLAGCERPRSPSLTGPDFTVAVPSGSIGDRVWFDANRNGAQNAGEAGMVGWTVTLFGSGAYVAMQTTGANGAYVFAGLSSGSYRVCVQPRQGYVPSWDLDGVGTANCAVVNLTPGSVRTDADFGYAQPVGSIGDRVWHDANGNRAPDTGEAGLASWVVRISGASLPAGYVATQSTTPSGAYGFAGLPGGTYQVCVTARPGYAQTFDLDGTATPHCATLALSPGQTYTDVDFGYWRPSSIGDRVWNDANGNRAQDPSEAGLAGWTVTISGTALPAGYAAAQIAGPTGAYAFLGLPAGTYRVCIAPQTGWTPTYDLDGTGTPHCATVPVVAGQSRTDADFGFRR
jgi:serine-aspartate repeat-containing protein C/D/E